MVLWCSTLSCVLVASTVTEIPVNDVQPGVREPAGGGPTKEPVRTGETLEDEMENQENVLTQLLGDYDKVKSLSEGSDCRCKCVVRPLSRSACQRIEEGSARAGDFYTVETVTAGPDCKKCACIAPPSALNPCEGDYRFKKLQEAGKDDINLSAIMDLLEGALYGMDLLKLHSVTTKLLDRVDNIEKAFNRTERVSVKTRSSEEKEREKERRAQLRIEKRKRMGDLERSLKKDAAAAYANTEKKYEERYVGGKGSNRPVLKRSQPEARDGSDQSVKGRWAGPNGSVIRGVTFYKAEPVEEGGAEETAVENIPSRKGSIDLLIHHQPPRPTLPAAGAGVSKDPPVSRPPAPERSNGQGTPDQLSTSEASLATSQPSSTPLTTTTTTKQPKITTTQPTTTTKRKTTTTTTTTNQPTTTTSTTTTQKTTTTTSPPPPSTTTTAATTTTTTPATGPIHPSQRDPAQLPSLSQSLAVAPSLPTRAKTRLSWTESPADAAPTTPKDPGECKDTLATILDPVTVNTYGQSEGAWMKDPKGNGQVIYVTNNHYGNNLLEFRDLDNFRQGQVSNSYKLPYSWMGTGHVVYHGSFYYNRAFSRDIIKFNLRGRYVAAWTTLQDAVLLEAEGGLSGAPWGWEGQSEMELAVDEGGVWLLYPALDLEGFHQEVIVLSRLNPRDLRSEATFRTGLRRRYYGNSFLICGVLYAVDSYNRPNANVSYAFDTHTNTQMVPRLPFSSNYSLTAQLDYNPMDRKLYAWDNGHQVNYDVIFAY